MAETKVAKEVFHVQRSGERFFADHDWLKTYHSFSFADYYDPNNLNWGALRVFNDDTIAGGTGFPTHPHRDMEIVTYVLDGELEHQDSMGNRGVVRPGGIQYMSAGTGVRHSEYNHSPAAPLRLVQMWVLPGEYGVKPSYGQEQYERSDRTGRWLTVASGQNGVGSKTRLMQDASLHVARLERTPLAYAFGQSRYGFLFVADGDVSANGTALRKGDAARIFNVPALEVSGAGELVLWDVPPTDTRLEDA